MTISRSTSRRFVQPHVHSPTASPYRTFPLSCSVHRIAAVHRTSMTSHLGLPRHELAFTISPHMGLSRGPPAHSVCRAQSGQAITRGILCGVVNPPYTRNSSYPHRFPGYFNTPQPTSRCRVPPTPSCPSLCPSLSSPHSPPYFFREATSLSRTGCSISFSGEEGECSA